MGKLTVSPDSVGFGEGAMDSSHHGSEVYLRKDCRNGHLTHTHGDEHNGGDALRGLEPWREDHAALAPFGPRYRVIRRRHRCGGVALS